MYESSEGQAPAAPAAQSPVDAAFVVLLDELFTGPRVTYAPVRESPTYYGGHRYRRPAHRRFVLRAGADLDDPR
ncbi:hypothetical protein ACFT2C_12085 [Promicromonospora sp. NPDC057138]|uniref:hypothetical protein n=1 Tax=Promicromonospora sp. NPDC057138 TaxID=3346031 RepID=UPI00362AEB46